MLTATPMGSTPMEGYNHLPVLLKPNQSMQISIKALACIVLFNKISISFFKRATTPMGREKLCNNYFSMWNVFVSFKTLAQTTQKLQYDIFQSMVQLSGGSRGGSGGGRSNPLPAARFKIFHDNEIIWSR